MIALLWFFLTLFTSPFKSKSRLEAENAELRHQLIVLQRRVSGRVQLTNGDRLFLVMLYRWFHRSSRPSRSSGRRPLCAGTEPASGDIGGGNPAPLEADRKSTRSEEHTSELQSPDHLVCRLLLEKKNTSDTLFGSSTLDLNY